MTVTTTLKRIREHSPCDHGWKKLLRHLGKTQADDETLSLMTVLDSNGLEDALWCLRACEGIDRKARLFAVWCIRQVQHLLTDPRSLAALDVAERYALGQATDDELDEAYAAAHSAVFNTAHSPAFNAAHSAASTAAVSSAWTAAKAAARDAAHAAAAHSAAAHVAAWDEASDAAYAAAYYAAYDEARAAARATQEQHFRLMFS